MSSERIPQDILQSQLIHNFPYAIVVINGDTSIEYVNPAFEKLTGFPAGEIIGAKPPYPWWLQDTQQLATGILLNMMKHEARSYEVHARKKNGSTFWAEVSNSHIKEEGQLKYLFGIWRDITNRKRGQEALKKSEQNFRASVDISPLPTFITKGRDSVVYANQALLNLFGFKDITEFNSTPISKTHTPEYVKIIHARSDAIKQGIPMENVQGELTKIYRPDGAVLDVEVYSHGIDWDGEPADQVIFYDITERLNAEREMKAAKELSENIIMNSADMIITTDMDRKITLFNDAAEEVFGYTREEVIGKTVTDLYADQEQASEISAMIARDGMFWGEILNRRKNGEIFPSHISASFIRDSNGKTIGTVGVSRDITEIKKAEQSLRDSERNFRDALENQAFGCRIYDLDGNIVYSNPAIARLYGYDSVAELNATTKEQRMTARSFRESERREKMISSGGQLPSRYEFEIVRKDGDIRLLEAFTNPVTWFGARHFQITYIDITERKRAEEALRRSEQNFRTSFDVSLVATFITRGHGDILYANQALLDLCGNKNFEEFRNTPITERHTPEHVEIIKKRWSDWDNGHPTNETAGDITEIHRPDGDNRIVEIFSHQIEWDGEKVNQVIYNDITERVLAERYQKLNQEILQILNQNDDMQSLMSKIVGAFRTRVGFDAVGIRLETGDDYPFYSQSGFSDEFITRDNSLLERSEDGTICRDAAGKPNLECTCGLVISGKTDTSNPFFTTGGSAWTNDASATIETPDTEIPWYHPRNLCIHAGFNSIAIIPIRNGEEIVGLLQLNDRRKGRFTLNVIEKLEEIASQLGMALMRKKAEEDLIRETRTRNALLDSLPFIALILKKDTHEIVDSNAAAKKIGAVPGKTCYETCAEREDYCPFCLAPKLIETNEEQFIETEYRGRWYQGIWVPFSDDYYAHYIIDITERKLFESEQQQSARIESVGTLAGGIAHDFNNILTGIMGNIGLARMNLEDDDKEETADRLKDAEQATLRARDLTQQLLTFSRGGAPVKKSINLANVLRETVDFALRGSAEKPEYDLYDGLWAIEADEGQLNQVISNIIINADQSMPQGGIINVTARNMSLQNGDIPNLPKGNYVKISIEDHGVGMSTEIVKRVFEPYFTTKQKGSGLGLATSYSIVRNHGGLISVESVVSQGTTFHIYLPALKKAAPKKVEEAVQPNLSGHGRILVMDDEPTIRILLQKQLKMIGYETEVAKDGEEAIERYRQALAAGRPFDIVIMDLTVPGGMGGKEAIVKLREIDPQVKAIVSSGYSNDPIMAHPEEYGFMGVTAKPFQIQDLDMTLKSVMNRR